MRTQSTMGYSEGSDEGNFIAMSTCIKINKQQKNRD
jgi:hypothetical protein